LKAGKDSSCSFVRSLVRCTGHSGDEPGSVNVLMILVLEVYLADSLFSCRAKLQLTVEKADLKSMYVQSKSKDR
jgi:hypothetical protein